VTVNAARTAPTVNAGPPQTITLPANTFGLTGTSSGTNGATIRTIGWTQVNGPNIATLSSVSSLVTTVTGFVAGVYNFLLTVVDNNGLSDSASVRITVNAANTPPNVNAGSPQTINLPASSVTLTGTASGNNGATISSIQWKESRGPNTAIISSDSSLSTSVTGLVLGFYVFQLAATDNNGLSSVSTVFVTIEPVPNIPPIAKAGPDQTIILPLDSANLDGTESSDPDGTIDSYAWTELSGPGAITIVNSNTATATAENLQAGIYVFQLTVTDNSGAATSGQVTITVNPSIIKPPVANAGHDTTLTIPADTAVLNGSASSDLTGTIATYQWTELSGPTNANILSSSAAVSGVSNLVVGDYVFGLTVTDNHGLSSQASVKVHVVSNLRFTGEIKLYPNPANGIVNLRLISDSVGSILVNIYDMNGRVVQSSLLVKDQEYFYKSFDISGLKKGVYILETIVGIDNIMSIKFIKQ
jgi:Secretion system C-terminal sorting domain/PKD domain